VHADTGGIACLYQVGLSEVARRKNSYAILSAFSTKRNAQLGKKHLDLIIQHIDQCIEKLISFPNLGITSKTFVVFLMIFPEITKEPYLYIAYVKTFIYF
jgi:hypothetical protein